MQQSEHKWVLAGGAALAFLASAVNVDFLLSLGVSVSHLTGDVARITSDAVRGAVAAREELYLLGAAVGGFVAGATLAGVFIHRSGLDLRRPYGRSIAGIGSMLVVAALARGWAPEMASCLAAMACGLQNGLATHYRGMILRTTHITGVLTDFGVAVGMRLRGRSGEGWRMIAHGTLALSSAAGAAFGAALHAYTRLPVLLCLGGCYLVGGIGWSIAKRRWRLAER